MAIWYS